MKVILNKDISNIGEEGDIKDVARGYARNYLIPKNLVMPYTREALAILESRREHLGQRRDERRKAALDTKTRLENEDLILEMPAGERGRLFGSVTGANIVDALAAQGITVERKRLEIPDKTIKAVGTTRVRVRLYGDEEAELKVVVQAVGSAASGGAARQSGETQNAGASAAEATASSDSPEGEGVDDSEPKLVGDVAAPTETATANSTATDAKIDLSSDPDEGNPGPGPDSSETEE